MKSRMKNLRKRIERLNKIRVTGEDEDISSYLTKEQIEQLECARKMRLAAKVARSEDGEKE